MSKRDALRQRLLQSQEDVLATVSGLDAEQSSLLANEGWSVREMLAHLASAELGHCQVVQRLLQGKDTKAEDFDLDTFNNAEVNARQDRSVTEILEEYRANRSATLELLDTIDESDWEKSGYHPGGFDTTIEGVFRVISIHEKRHLREIKSALAP
ncbi:MAG: DinB family protein [Caldilineales bacterium]|nr:DinB family protein [Caldilineales bacterium]